MRITDLLGDSGPFLSLEFFPPKEKGSWPDFFKEVDKLKEINPLFVSVTYGAGGGTQANTLEIVARLRKEHGFEPMAHLTCVGASEEKLRGFLDGLEREGIDNVLALRGDPPRGGESFEPSDQKFRHASDLVAFIKACYPGLGVGVAAYPETHPAAVSAEDDLRYLKLKLDRGGDFAITQLFFDNGYYWDFVEKARAIGIDKPIIPGVLPIFNIKTVDKIASLCGAVIPSGLRENLNSARERGGEEAVMAVGVEHARAQAQNLLDNGAPGVHLYTLNKAEACLGLFRKLRIPR